MRRRQAQEQAIKLDFADIKYLHQIVDWAHDNGVLDKKEHKRAARWVDKPWPSAWQSYKCGSRTGDEAWDEARLLTGAAVKAFMRNDRRHVETMLVNNDTDNSKDYNQTEEVMTQKDIHPFDHEFFSYDNGFSVVNKKNIAATDATANVTYGKWDRFCRMTDEAADSGDWDAVLKDQRNDYYKNGAIMRAETMLNPYAEHKFIDPGGIYVQKPGAFQRIKAREKARRR